MDNSVSMNPTHIDADDMHLHMCMRRHNTIGITTGEELHAEWELTLERVDLEALLLEAGEVLLELLGLVSSVVAERLQEHGVALGLAL